MDTVFLNISKNMKTLIDAEDYERLKKENVLKWNAQIVGKKIYCSRNWNNKKVYLHRYIMNCPDGFCIDHINGDPLDNRKINLRICSFRENARNVIKDGFKGVTRTSNGKYQAQIQHKDAHITLGVFHKASEAARMYDLAAALIFKDFAALNFEFSKKFFKLLD